MIRTAYDGQSQDWAIAWPERVARYDLVYLTPPFDPLQGLPLGNGDVGALCWCESTRLVIQVNKCDLWDDAAFGHFSICSHDAEESCTSLKHAGRLLIDFGLPVFDPFYLDDFSARVSLADASIALTARGPLGAVTITAFIHDDTGVLSLEIDSDLLDDVPVEVTLERFGSRIYSRWYSHVYRNPALGLHGTQASHDAEGIQLCQQVAAGTFAIGCRAVARQPLQVETQTRHRHAAAMRLSSASPLAVSLFVGVVAPTSDPLPALHALLNSEMVADRAARWATHCRAWQRFWLRSLLECGDDYLDNLWHLTMFYLNASQRGAYPGRFINGLWGWNRDVQPWNVFFHWNQQTLYWPLHAAGHHELLHSYLNFRFDTLSHACEDARAFFDAEGAFVCDLSERRGYNSASEHGNHTPVAEIALDFWRQYRYTGDGTLLQAQVLPYLIEAALFFESRFERRDDGQYHAREGTVLEGGVSFTDAAPELAYGRALFAAVLAALREAGAAHPHAARWQELLDHLAPLPMTVASDAVIASSPKGWTYQVGWFTGECAASNHLLAAGFRLDCGQWVPSLSPMAIDPPPMPDVHTLLPYIETHYLQQYTPMGYTDIFPEAEYLSIYPTGLLSLQQRDTDLFQAAVNTARLYAPGLGGYDRTAVVLARLGLGREAWQVIASFPCRWQYACNGFGHYNWGMKADQALRFHVNYPVDVDSSDGRRVPMYSAPFRHMGMEAMSVLCTAINECLLQSEDGILRIGPAVREDQCARFTLHAVDGFVVSAEIVQGKPAWIRLTSRLGKRCTIANPWSECHLVRNGAPPVICREPIIAVETNTDDHLVLTPAPVTADEWQCVPIVCTRNDAPKVYGDGHPTLGLPKMF